MPYLPAYTPSPKRPASGAQPGTKILYDACAEYFPTTTGLGIYNPRDVCGNLWPHWKCKGSQHAAGRALDRGVTLDQNGRLTGQRLATWLTTHHLTLGVQEVIWYRRRWDNMTRVWRTYSGRSPHVDHVHAAQSQIPAVNLTAAQVKAVAPGAPIPGPLPPQPPTKDDDMASIVKGNASTRVYATNWIHKNHIPNASQMQQMILAGAISDEGSPFVVDQPTIDGIPDAK